MTLLPTSLGETTWDLYTSLLVRITLTIILALISSFSALQVLKKIEKSASSQPEFWSQRIFNSFIKVANAPLQLAIFSYALFTIFELSARSFNFSLEKSLFVSKKMAIIMVVSWLILRWKNQVEKLFIESLGNKSADIIHKATVTAVSKLLHIAIITVSSLTTLDLLGVPLSTLIAFTGAGAVASGLAAKDIVANFFGGFMIFVTRPFSVSDWISSPDKKIEGTVISIGWYMTCILSFEKRPIYVPNAIFSSLVLVNPSRMTNRRILQTIGVRYSDIHVLPQIIKETEEMLFAHPEIDTSQTLMVHFTSFGPYSLDFNIYTFTKTTDWKKWREIQQDVLFKVAEIIDAHEAAVAFPRQEIEIQSIPTR